MQMKRSSVWISALLLLLLTLLVGTAAADTIRRGGNDVVLTDGTMVAGVWNNSNTEFLTLKANGDAILYVSRTLYVCSWSWDAGAIYLNHNGWILTITPQGSTLRADVHGKTLTLTRAGDFVGNVGMWYPSGNGGGYTLQLRASGEYLLRHSTDPAVSGKWVDAGGYVILLKDDGSYDVCTRSGAMLKLKRDISVYTLVQEAQPTATPRSYATPSPSPTPLPMVDERLVGSWRPSGSSWNLLLNGDGTAVLGDGKQAETGFWRLSGNRCTITMASQTYEATYNGTFVRLTLDGKNLSFSRKGAAAEVTGSWAADGYALVISADGSFVGSWGGGAYSGSWQFDGQNVYLSGSNGLTVFKVASGKLQIKVNGKTVLLRKADSESSAVVSVPSASGGTAGTPAPAVDSRALLGKWVEPLDTDIGWTLLIQADGTAVLKDFDDVYSCEWRLAGNVLTLTSNGRTIATGFVSNVGVIEVMPVDDIDFTGFSLRREGAAAASASASSGGIVGYWTEMTMDGITLDIRQGGSAVLVIDGDSYNCKWQLSGSNLTLSDNGSPIRGTYNSQTGVIQLTVETYTFTFRKGGTSGASAGSSARSVVGTWTQHVVGGTVTLTIRSGGSATLKIATTQYACTWKLSGSTFTLINNGVPINGTYNSQTDTISIIIGTARLNLTRTGN